MKTHKIIPASAVLMRGNTSSNLGSHDYIVYADEKGDVRVNADFRRKGGCYIVCIYYENLICPLEYFDRVPQERIDSLAYGAYMDGAR